MMHQQIEEQEIIERYVRNQLTLEERKAFEEHYFSCEDCFEKLGATERFIAGVRNASRRGLLTGVSQEKASVWHIAPHWVKALAASGVAVLLLAIVSSSWYYVRVSRLRGQLSASSIELQRERAARVALAQQLELAVRAEPNVPLVMLQSTRDVEGQPTETTLPAGAAHLVLWMEVPVGRFNSYRLEVYGADDKPIVTLDHLARNPYGALAACLPTQQLQSGDFRIRLLGENPSPAILLAEYKLRIRKP
jgi:hypothetical protein